VKRWSLGIYELFQSSNVNSVPSKKLKWVPVSPPKVAESPASPASPVEPGEPGAATGYM
jgi:hypothetical protein